MCHHIQLIFVCLVETGFHYVGQAGLELLTSGDLPASASQSAEITGVSHLAQPHSWNKFHLLKVYTFISNLLLSVYWYFVEDICICVVHKEYQSVVFCVFFLR